MGWHVSAAGDYSTALGYISEANGISAVAIGYFASSTGNYATAMGNTMTVSGNNSFGIGLADTGFTLSASNTFAVVGGKSLFGTTTDQAYQVFIDAGVSTTAGLGVNGYVLASGYITGSSSLDLAETYPINPVCAVTGDCPEPGDAICISSSTILGGGNYHIEKCTAAYSEQAIGVISTDPGFTLGGLNTSTTRKVALAGRVPLKVSLKNGPIEPGDKLTTSDIPGVAMKASSNGPTIGIALESYEATNQLDPTIVVFVNRGHHYQSLATELAEAASASLDDGTAGGSILRSFMNAILNGLRQLGVTVEQGLLKVKEFVADKITTKQLCVGTTCVTQDELQQLLDKNQILNQSAPAASTPAPGYSPSLPPGPTDSVTSTDASTVSLPSVTTSTPDAQTTTSSAPNDATTTIPGVAATSTP